MTLIKRDSQFLRFPNGDLHRISEINSVEKKKSEPNSLFLHIRNSYFEAPFDTPEQVEQALEELFTLMLHY